MLVIQRLRTQSPVERPGLSGGESLVLGDRTHVLEVIPSVWRKADFTQAATIDLRFQDEIDKAKRKPFQAKGTARTRQKGQFA